MASAAITTCSIDDAQLLARYSHCSLHRQEVTISNSSQDGVMGMLLAHISAYSEGGRGTTLLHSCTMVRPT